jgi:hypothetical protein
MLKEHLPRDQDPALQVRPFEAIAPGTTVAKIRFNGQPAMLKSIDMVDLKIGVRFFGY